MNWKQAEDALEWIKASAQIALNDAKRRDPDELRQHFALLIQHYATLWAVMRGHDGKAITVTIDASYWQDAHDHVRDP